MTDKIGNLILRGATGAIIVFLSVWIVARPDLAPAEDGEAAPAAQEAAPAQAAAPAIDAAPLWAKNCKSCHGEDGKGQTKAGKMKKVKDLTDAEVREGFDRERMLKSVSEGIDDDAGKVLMKPYNEKLSAAELAALVDYVFALPH